MSIDPLAYSGGQQVFSPYAAMGNSPGMMIDPNGEMFNPFVENNIMEQQSEMEQSISNEKGSRKTFFGLNALNTLMAAGGGGGNMMGTVHSGANAVLALGKSMMKVFNGLRSLFDRSEIQTANTISGNNYNSGSISPVDNVGQPNDGNVVFPEEVYGYYPTTSIYNSPGDLKVYEVDKFKYRYQDNMITSYEVKLHPSMILALTQKMNEVQQSPGNYSVFSLNCTSFAVGMLQKIAIYIYVNESNCLSPYPINGVRMTPQHLNNILERDYNKNTFINRTRFKVNSSMQ